MAKRKFNWVAAAVLVLSLIVLAVTVFGLRQWQLNRKGAAALVSGLEAYQKGMWFEAAANLGQYISINQTDKDILLKYADAQLNIRPLKRNNIQQALTSYRSVLRLEGGNSVAAERLARLYLEMDIMTEAELIARRYLETNSAPDISIMLAISLERQRKRKEAASVLRTLINEYPDYIPAYQAMGRLSDSAGDDIGEPAQFWFDEAVKNNPDSADAFIIRAGFLREKHQPQKAAEDLQKAQTLDLSDPNARLRLVRELAGANMFDEALSHLVQIRRQNSRQPGLWKSWAMVAIKMNSKEQMLRVAEDGLKELSGNSWDFMPAATELFIRGGETEVALRYIEELKQKGAAPAVTVFLEGLLAGARNEDHKTVQAWRRAIELGDRSANTQLALARALSLCGDNQSAIVCLNKLVSEQPDVPDAHIELARFLSQSGNWAFAAEHARAAMEISPGNVDAALAYLGAQIELLNAEAVDSESAQWSRIEQSLNELEVQTSGTWDVVLLRFRLAMRRKDYGLAEKLLTNLQEHAGQNIEIEMAQVELFAAQERTDEAIAKLSAIREAFPENTRPVMYFANLLNLQNKQAECENLLKMSISETADVRQKRELGIALARFYELWQQSDKAVELLEKLSQELRYDVPVRWELLRYSRIKQDKRHTQEIVDQIKVLEGEHGWRWRCGQAGIWLNDEKFTDFYPRIIELLKANLVANPDDQTSRMLLASAYEKAGELQLASATYREALNRSPEDIRIIISTISVLYKTKEYEQADAILKRVTAGKIDSPELSMLELQSCIQQGKLDSAENILEDMLARSPDNSEVSLSLALLKIRQGKYDQAEEILARLRLAQPQDISIASASAELNLKRGNSENALAVCNQIVEQLGNASAYILRARVFFLLGKQDSARDDLEHAVSIEPENIEPWIAKSDFNRSTGRLAEAAADIQKALEMEPANINIQKRAISLFLSSSDSEKVQLGTSLLEKALASSPRDTDLRLYHANLLLASGVSSEISQAKGILQVITREQPQIPEAWALLGQMHLLNSELAKAMDVILQGLSYSPEDTQLLLLKGRTEAATAPKLAIPTLKGLLELEPSNTDLVLELASTYLAADEAGEGITLLEDTLRQCEPNDRRKVDIALAFALYKNSDKARAEQRFEELYKSAPDDPEILLAEAKCLIEDKQCDKVRTRLEQFEGRGGDSAMLLVSLAGQLAAVADTEALAMAEGLFRRVLEREPDSAGALHNLAVLMQMTGRYDESASLYQRIIEKDPSAVVAVNNLAWIMCENRQEYEKARRLAQEGLQKAPDYIDLIDTHGVICYRMGDYQRAIRDFERCMEMYPESSLSKAAAHFHLGRTLAAMNQSGEAMENLSRALELSAQRGGLSASDAAESENLLRQLSHGESYARPVSR